MNDIFSVAWWSVRQGKKKNFGKTSSHNQWTGDNVGWLFICATIEVTGFKPALTCGLETDIRLLNWEFFPKLKTFCKAWSFILLCNSENFIIIRYWYLLLLCKTYTHRASIFSNVILQAGVTATGTHYMEGLEQFVAPTTFYQFWLSSVLLNKAGFFLSLLSHPPLHKSLILVYVSMQRSCLYFTYLPHLGRFPACTSHFSVGEFLSGIWIS